MRTLDAIRSFSALDPLCQRSDAIKFVGAIAAGTVVHAGNHEQPDGIGGLGCSTEYVQTLVVLNRTMAEFRDRSSRDR
jgi:hypothetical protein